VVKSFDLSWVAAVALIALVGCSQGGNQPDVVYKHGKIYTVNESAPWAEAVAIKDGKFFKVGTSAEVEALAGANTDIVDLAGRMAMPGIVDLHVHPFATPLFNIINLDFSEPTNPEKMIAEVKEFADSHPGKKWIRGGSWGVGVFPNNSPGKGLLDAVVADRPVVLIDQTGHAYWLNSKALELAGIDASTHTDEKYIIDKDPNTGEPTGVVRESSLRLVEQVAEQPTEKENAQAFQEVFAEFNSKGVTTMQTAEGHVTSLDIVQQIENEGLLSMRLFVSWDWHTHQTTPYTDEEMDEQIANRSKYASELIDPNFVKIFLDGTPDGYAVPLIEPYSDGSGRHGTGKLTPEELRDVVVAYDAEGVSVFMHSIGDASARSALDAIQAAREANGDTGVRHKVAHLVWVHVDDMPRFASIPGVAAEISPAVTYPSAAFDGYVKYVGQERSQQLYPARSLINAGAHLGYGSDWLTMIPPSPWMPMQGFVTRTNPDMPERGELGVDETLTLEQAIRVFTINGAYAVGADDRIGSIEEGKLADMIVLEKNLFEIEASEIRNTQVLKTILNGKLVYERGQGD